MTGPRDAEARVRAAAAAVERLVQGPARPAERAALARAMALGPMPPELAAVLQRTDGLALDECEIWDLGDILAYPGAGLIAQEYPGGVVFGWNRADIVLMLDGGDTLHAGAGAVFALDKVYLQPRSAVLCAPDLGAFLDAAAPGHRPWRGQTLMRRQAAEIARLLVRHADRVDARPPPGRDAMIAAAAAREVQLTASLAAFYEVAGGLRFVRSGLEIEGPGGLAPVAGARRADGTPGAIWIGGLPDGLRLALTTEGWERPSDLVLQMREGAQAASAPAYGRLLSVLIGWLTSEASNAP